MSAAGPAARIAVDVGGTFTDAALLTADGGIRVAKVPSTPEHPAAGFAASLEATAALGGESLADVAFLAHGTTVATNALVQRRGARVGLLLTAGFRDVLAIGTQQRTAPYDPRTPNPAPLVPEELCFEIRERVGAGGEVVEELSEPDVAAAARGLRDAGAEAVAVCLLFSFANPAHEQRVRDLLTGALDGLPISLSSEVSPVFREYPRASTTAINAALLPLMGRYLGELVERTRELAVSVPVNLMQSNGGLASPERGAEVPVNLIASGPAAGVIGATRVGELAGAEDLLTFDMGGTTADVGLVIGGRAQMRFDGEFAGHPISIPQTEVLSVGAGAGSIARVDQFGSLLVGPESAGAEPGPAAYGRGGERATVADAHLVMGAIHPDAFLGGRMEVDIEAARRAVDRDVATPLDLTTEEAAGAILRIADSVMAGALRVLSIARGHDPRRLTLVAFGGAGPLHACRLAEDLGITEVLVPRYPGAGSAVGMLSTDVRYDFSETWGIAADQASEPELRERLDRLGEEGEAQLRLAGIDADAASVEFEVGMRYRGQAYELSVPAGGLDGGGIAAIEEEFQSAHRQAYGHTLAAPIELVTLRARAIGHVEADAWGSADAPVEDERDDGSRMIWTESSGFERHLVLRRETLPVGKEIAGPAVIEQDDSTTLLMSGWRLVALPEGTLRLWSA